MFRFKGSFLLLPLATAGLWLAMMNGCGGNGASPNNVPANTSKIQHVVIIFQENRSTDNLFHDPVLISRGADISSTGVDSTGASVPLTPVALGTNWDNDHSHPSFTKMYDNGKMDGAQLIPLQCPVPTDCTPPPNRPFNYVRASDVQPYFAMAETYAFNDRMFQTNEGPSFPAHHFIISGTSAPTPPGQTWSNYFVAENAKGPLDETTGCLGTAQNVLLIDPANMDPLTNETQTFAPPCFDHPTLTDLLDTANLNWAYYASFAGVLWNGPTEIKHICQPAGAAPNAKCTGPIWTEHERIPPATVLTDIQNNALESVVWVTPNSCQSDHAGTGVECGEGPAWVASIVNAIGNSSYWANTAIILTWDDWGGWYDHVAPTILNSYEFGFRVPLVVISPYAKAGYVSHQV
ncbi:MAG TPA: alkaline phosphatase family protein [Terriglobales bacterium]